MGTNQKGPKRGYSKSGIPRHRTLSPSGAAAMERAIEKQERQAGKKAIEYDRLHSANNGGEPSQGVYDDWKVELNPDWRWDEGGA